MDDIVQLGHMPRQSKNRASAKEQCLYFRLWRARTVGSLTKEQEAALDKLAQASVTKVMQQVRDLGYYPKASAGRGLAERQLAEKLRRAWQAMHFSPEQEAEFKAFQQAESDERAEAKSDERAQTEEHRAKHMEELLQQVRDLGRYRKNSAERSLAERQVAEKPRKRRAGSMDRGMERST